MLRLLTATALILTAPVLTAPAAMAAEVLTTGTIAWQGCDKGYPTDIRFEKHKKAGRVEVIHDGEGGSIDMNADNTIGADNQAGKDGKAKTIKVSGSITKGTVTRGSCTGSFQAK